MRIKITIILMIFILLFGCIKKNNNSKNNTQKSIENTTLYLKEKGALAYINEADLEKDFKSINGNDKKYFEFGTKFLGLKSKQASKNIYYLVRLPDKTEYWIQSDYIAEKFIIINRNDVSTYNQPDIDYKTSVKLQPGDFGVYVKEQGEWILVDFYAYRPYEKNGERSWVGQKWINEGYTSDLRASKEAYYLYYAYLYTFNQKIKSKERALEFLKKAQEINNGEETEISFALKNFQSEIESGKYF